MQKMVCMGELEAWGVCGNLREVGTMRDEQSYGSTQRARAVVWVCLDQRQRVGERLRSTGTLAKAAVVEQRLTSSQK
jgi:hypothetical protein